MPLSIDPHGDGFFLRKIDDNGVTTGLILTAIDLVTLAEMSPLLRQAGLLSLQNRSEQAQAASAIPVERVDVVPDLLQEHFLLTIHGLGTGGTRATFAFPVDLAQTLAGRLVDLLSRIRGDTSRQQ